MFCLSFYAATHNLSPVGTTLWNSTMAFLSHWFHLSLLHLPLAFLRIGGIPRQEDFMEIGCGTGQQRVCRSIVRLRSTVSQLWIKFAASRGLSSGTFGHSGATSESAGSWSKRYRFLYGGGRWGWGGRMERWTPGQCLQWRSSSDYKIASSR